MSEPPRRQPPRLHVIHSGWATFGVAEISERDGSRVKRTYEDHGSAASVLPYDPDRRVATLVRQMRVGPLLAGDDGDIAEAPAGAMEADEDPAATAVREALEEAGLRLAALEPVGQPFTMPGISTERLYLYLARYGEGDRIAAGGGLAAEGEQIIVEEVPLDALAEQARCGAVRDMKTLVLVQALMLRRPELFGPEGAGATASDTSAEDRAAV